MAFEILGHVTELLRDSKPASPRHDSQPAVDGESTESSSFAQLLDETRNFVTITTIDTYPDRESQRCVPTFVTVAGGILHGIHERGGLRTKEDFGMGDLTAFIGHLNMFWMAAFFADKMPVNALTENMLGLGYAYHLTDNQIADWQNTVQNCHGDESPIGRLVAYFDRIVEPIAQIIGADYLARSQNWITLLREINAVYHQMMDNAEWIAELDSALGRA